MVWEAAPDHHRTNAPFGNPVTIATRLLSVSPVAYCSAPGCVPYCRSNLGPRPAGQTGSNDPKGARGMSPPQRKQQFDNTHDQYSRRLPIV